MGKARGWRVSVMSPIANRGAHTHGECSQNVEVHDFACVSSIRVGGCGLPKVETRHPTHAKTRHVHVTAK